MIEWCQIMSVLNVSQNVKKYNIPVLGKLLVRWNRILGIEIPREVQIGENVNFAHNSVGSVIHSRTRIEDDVIIFPGVTIGKADIYEDWKHSKVEGFVIAQGAALCAGAKILCKEGTLRIGKHAIIAANAVVTHSVGPYEIWGEYLLNV